MGATDTGEGPDAAELTLNNHFEGSTDGRREPATGQIEQTKKAQGSAKGVQVSQNEATAQSDEKAGAQDRVTTQTARRAKTPGNPTDDATEQQVSEGPESMRSKQVTNKEKPTPEYRWYDPPKIDKYYIDPKEADRFKCAQK